MSDRFTEIIDPYALAKQGRSIEGKVALSELKRVLPLLQSSTGEVEFSLDFDTDEAGIPRVRGNVRTKLILQCQRCMEDMEFPVLSKVRLGIVRSRDAAEHLPDSYDPLVCDEDASIISMLEDELILAMPVVAMHNIEDCPQGESFSVLKFKEEQREGERNDAGTERKNPFAVLAQLKGSQSEDKTE